MSEQAEVEVLRSYKVGDQLTRTLAEPSVSVGAVVGAVAKEAIVSVAQAAAEYQRMVQENAELRGIISVLKAENEWLRGMIDKVVK